MEYYSILIIFLSIILFKEEHIISFCRETVKRENWYKHQCQFFPGEPFLFRDRLKSLRKEYVYYHQKTSSHRFNVCGRSP